MRVSEAVRLRILELCQERDLSVNRLSGMCGLTQSTLNNIVSGRNKSATVSTAKKICDGLDISQLYQLSLRLSEWFQQSYQIWLLHTGA